MSPSSRVAVDRYAEVGIALPSPAGTEAATPGMATATTQADRTCGTCGRPLDGYRQHARYCGGPCRAAASRERDEPRGGTAALEAFTAGLVQGVRRNRTQAHRRRLTRSRAAGAGG